LIPLLACASAALLLCGCASKKKTVLRRMAIVPTNVLLNDAGSDWLKLGVPVVLQQDFISTPFTAPQLAASETNLSEIGAQDILRTKVEDRSGKIHIEATVLEAASQKITSSVDTEASSMATLIPALNQLAKKIDPEAGDFSTKNTDALKYLASAAQQRDNDERAGLLGKAVDIDPNFGLAYFLLLEMAAPAGPARYKPALDQAQLHSAAFTPYDRARFNLISLQLNRAPMSQRTAAAEALLKIAPNDVDGLAIVAGIRFLSGDVNGGVAAIKHAIELSPGNPNLKGELAEGLVQSRRFAEAEKVLADDKSPNALPEMASLLLLEGDAARANATAERYFALVKNPDYQTLVRAAWTEFAGDRAKAIAAAEGSTFTNPTVRSLALSEAAVWRMMNKDFAGAQKDVDAAGKTDHPTAVSTMAGLLISGSESPDDWRKKIEGSPLNPQLKGPILAYGFFLNGHYDQAAVEWKKILDMAEGNDLRARAMLAASLEHTGGGAEAQKIKVQPFLVREFADIFGGVVFGEMERLTGIKK
jgi:hypothetical protein